MVAVMEDGLAGTSEMSINSKEEAITIISRLCASQPLDLVRKISVKVHATEHN